MRKTLVVVCMAVALSLLATVAGAENIKGKVGVTGRIGFIVPTDSEVIAGGGLANISTDVGFTGGGGFIYGIEKYLAAELEVTHSSFGTNGGRFGIGDGNITDISFGVQYRFPERNSLTPYVGAGLDVLINGLDATTGSNPDVDTVAGVHARGGIDYFLTKEFALNADAKAVLAPTADIKVLGSKVGNFDATNFSTLFGVRFFFY
ncbi:MAG TPA: porin family protein [Geobacteraceae bacterium]